MSELIKMLADVDDEYLIGLSNKGIVKRAYKDMAELAPEVETLGEEVLVKVGEETCRIVYPLGDSRCSCASRSVCKHLVMAILKLKSAAGQGSTKEVAPAGTAEQENPFPEISAYLFEPLRKALGTRRYQALLSSAKAGEGPEIQVTSVITVTYQTPPDTGIVVKLLEPVQHSACSCHKKELCEHKAASILWYQLSRNLISLDTLSANQEERPEEQLDKYRELSAQVKELLEDGLRTGLARIPPDIMDSMERMALLCHNGRLPDFERSLRALGESYGQYFKRKASFRTEDLMMKTMRLYQRALLLLEAENINEAAGLAGEFRSEYLPVGELKLIGIGAKHFRSLSGYEGENYYFLEEKSKKWYVYTNARPVFYESSSKKRQYPGSQVPWGLSVRMEELAEYRISLKNAKVNEKGRISSSTETWGEVTGSRDLKLSEAEGWYYEDFKLLFEEQIEARRESWLFGAEDLDGEESLNGSQLVFLKVNTAKDAEFDSINQTFRMLLYDDNKVCVTVEVLYSKEESMTIRYLERLNRKIGSGKKEIPYFAGEIYIDGGMMKLYPVACFFKEEVSDDRSRQDL